MIVNMTKMAGGSLVPATDEDAELMKRFPSGEEFPVSIKLPRNPQFHRKVFAFFKFCFQYWSGGNEYQDYHGQFKTFRDNMVVLAGFRDEHFKIDGSIRVEARSLSFGSMSQEDFEQCYDALIQVALHKIFHNNHDNNIQMQLYDFFR